jgi:acylphosphatase
MVAHERVCVTVYGRVQGVFFRDSARRAAYELGLAGYVRNVAGGMVEIVAEGPRDALDRMAEWARSGPPAARVERVETVFGEATGEFSIFRIQY